MVNMKMSAKEAKEYAGVPEPGNAPKYPYGLSICLNSDSLEKLGFADLPAVGQKLQIVAVCEVQAVRSNQQQDGDKESSVDLQITDMEVGIGAGEVDASRLYKT